MEKIIFQLEEGEEYITLVNLLKYENIISSGGEIKNLLENEMITYNGEVEFRKKKKCYPNDVILVDNYEITIK